MRRTRAGFESQLELYITIYYYLPLAQGCITIFTPRAGVNTLVPSVKYVGKTRTGRNGRTHAQEIPKCSTVYRIVRTNGKGWLPRESTLEFESGSNNVNPTLTKRTWSRGGYGVCYAGSEMYGGVEREDAE